MKRTCLRGKHLKEKKSKKLDKEKVVFYTLLLIVFSIFTIKIPIDQKTSNQDQQENSIFTDTRVMDYMPENAKVNMPDKIEDYDVIGELIIEKINFRNYILNKTTEDSLNFSVTKFYGPKVNHQGNFCITGHNTKKELFENLKNLDIDDVFCIIDKENGQKVTYKVYDKYTVIPTNLNCLNQDTNNKREVTLITCNPRRVN